MGIVIIILTILAVAAWAAIRLWLWRRSERRWRDVIRSKLVEVEDQIRVLRLQLCDVEDKVDKTGVVWEETDDDPDDDFDDDDDPDDDYEDEDVDLP